MNTLSLKRGVTEFIHLFWRNKWMSLWTILAMAMVFFLTWMIFSVNSSSQTLIDRVEEKVDVGVFFEPDTRQFQIDALLLELETLQKDKKIQSYQPFSKDEALNEMKEKFPDKVRFLERYQLGNPLQASVEIVPGTWSPNEIFVFLEDPQFDDVIDRSFFNRYEEKKSQVNRILQLLSFFRQSGFFLVTVFLAISAFLIAFFVSSILHQRKKEIFIMRLVGAEHSFIRFPFVINGVFLALCSFLGSFVLFFLFLKTIAPRAVNFFTSQSDQVFLLQVLSELQYTFLTSFWKAIGFLILGAFIISFFTVEKFIRKHHLFSEE